MYVNAVINGLDNFPTVDPKIRAKLTERLKSEGLEVFDHSLNNLKLFSSPSTLFSVFEDAEGRMNHSLMDVEGAAMVISQFTLFGSLKKGNRPSFNRAALPEQAVPLYEAFCKGLSTALGRPVATGRFGEHMQIDAANDGPITLIVDTKDRDF